MDNTQSTSRDIKKHNFQKAINSIKEISQQLQADNITLERVDTNSWLIFDHDVTGKEFNERLEKIQDVFINFREFNQKVIGELREVYNAFDWIDSDYIRYINNILDEHGKMIKVLAKFKKNIERLNHFTDIDTAWELLEAQIDLSKELSDYRDSLSELQHLKDIDTLWDNTQTAIRDIQNINTALKQQDQVIAQFHETLKRIQEAQKQFINTVNQMTDSFREDFNNQMKHLEEEQTARLNAIDRKYAATMDNLATTQKETFAFMQNTLTSSLEAAVKEQTLSIQNIKNEQEEQFNQLAENQSTTLGQIADDQKGKLAEISNSLEEETVALNEQVNTLTQRVKNLSFVAGGAAVLAIIQLLFNVFGRM